MDHREWVLTKHLKAHDSKLYCRRMKFGPYAVYRESVRWESCAFESGTLKYSHPADHFIFALTDNWKTDGIQKDWGIEPVLAKIKECDTHNRDLAEELITSYEKKKEQGRRQVSSKAEDFFKDYRSEFARATNHVNTSTMEKIDPRRKHAY